MPELFVWVLPTTPVALLVADTSAPATTEFCESVTRPLIEPVTDWAEMFGGSQVVSSRPAKTHGEYIKNRLEGQRVKLAWTLRINFI